MRCRYCLKFLNLSLLPSSFFICFLLMFLILLFFPFTFFCYLTSLHFTSLHFTSHHFTSLLFPSLHVISYFFLFLLFLLFLLNDGWQMRDMRSRDRTPSFYTSRSILHLSGLSVADPVTPGCHRISPKSRSPSKCENDDNYVSECREGQEESDSSTDSDEITTTPSPGIQKTTSMSNFYYKRGGSSDEIPGAAQRATSA